MDRFVVMVDAGYLLQKSLQIVSGKASKERRDLELVDAAGLINLLVDQAIQALRLHRKQLLRVYWYDGVMSGGHTPQQRLLCELQDVNFRAGLVNSKGQQKGVDSLIITDLFELASNHAITDAALVTGDSDLAIGIELAQKKGVRIAVLGVEDIPLGILSGQSREITDRADRVVKFGSTHLARYLKFSPQMKMTVSAPAMSPVVTPQPATKIGGSLTGKQKADIDSAVTVYLAANPASHQVVDKNTRRIEAAIDKALLHHVFTTLAHGSLSEQEKVFVRECFRKKLVGSTTTIPAAPPVTIKPKDS